MRAWHLKQPGWTQRLIAAALGATAGAVSRWLAAAEGQGPDALRTRPRGRPPTRLTDAPRRLIPDGLGHGPEAYGSRGAVWTCARIAKVIAEAFGVAYHPDHVGRLLKELRWTPQVPITRARQRHEAAIEHGRTDVWPRRRPQARRERRAVVGVDASGFYLLPGVVRTYSPEGRTPVVDEGQTRDHLSVRGGRTPAGKVYVLVRPESLKGRHPVASLPHLLRYAGRRLLVIWDRSMLHRRAEVKEFVGRKAGRGIWVETVPG